ncbi:MAG: hypothetical protein P4M09_27095 [Devosia sp.]|nr:hypothetical protein [Devosia sp.]
MTQGRRALLPAVFRAVLFLVAIFWGHPARATWDMMSVDQAKQLLQQICTTPIHLSRDPGDDSARWVCDAPRSYPDPRQDAKGGCPLTFQSFEGIRALKGKFTAPREELLLDYRAACEPHVHRFGGSVLWRVDAGRLIFSAYFPGLRFNDCAVVSGGAGHLDRAYCFDSYGGQGDLEQRFGLVSFRDRQQPRLEAWMKAGNDDGAIPSIGCARDPGLHHFIRVIGVGSLNGVGVEAAILDPKSIASACERFRRKEFSDDEMEALQEGSFMSYRAFIREEEQRYFKVVIHFSGVRHEPKIHVTTENVSSGR